MLKLNQFGDLERPHALTDVQNACNGFLARPALAQCINLTAILITYLPVLISSATSHNLKRLPFCRVTHVR